MPSSNKSKAQKPSSSNPIVRWIMEHPLDVLLLAFPVALVMRYAGANDLWVFCISGLAIVPLAGLMGRATESLAVTLGAGLGGLLNATFGNAAELIIALFALSKGPQMYPLVKASITGSIIGNVLLVLGLAITAGGLRHQFQHFNRTAATMGATLLTLATVGLIMPTLYYFVFASVRPLDAKQLETVEFLSEEIAAILALVYVLSLVFMFVTHRQIYDVSHTRSGETKAEEQLQEEAAMGARHGIDGARVSNRGRGGRGRDAGRHGRNGRA